MTRKVDVEEFLKKFTLRPVPPELGKKIFPVRVQKRRAAAFWTPLQWKAVAAFLILGCSAALLDIGLTRLQDGRIAGLLTPPAVLARENGGRDEWLAEVWSGRADSAWIEVRLNLEKKAARLEVRRETSLYLKEEFDGS